MTTPSVQDVKSLLERATAEPSYDRTRPPEVVEQAKTELKALAADHPDLVIGILMESPSQIATFRELFIESVLDRLSETTRASFRDVMCTYLCTLDRRWSPRIMYSSLVLLQKMKAPEVLEPLLDRVAEDLPSQSRAQLQYFAATFKAIDAQKAVETLIARLTDPTAETTWIGRGQIAEVLGYMRDAQAVEPLQTLLQAVNAADGSDAGVAYCRTYTEAALKQLGVK